MPHTHWGGSIKPRFAAFAMLLSNLSYAYVLKRDSSGVAIRWNRPVEFVVDSNLSQTLGEPEALTAVQAALSSWSVAAPTLPLSVIAGQVNGMGYDQSDDVKNTNEVYGMPHWIFDANAIAVTLVTTDSDTHEILDADIALNIESHTFRVLPTPNGDNRFDDIQNVVTHEFGHALGLAHNPDDSTVVMFPSARLGETSKRRLAMDDEEGIAALYPPGGPRITAPTGCNAAPSGSDAWPFAGWIPALFLLGYRRRGAPVSTRGQADLGRALLAAALILPATGEAYQGERADAPAKDAAVVATAEVLSTRTHEGSKHGRVLFTEVELVVRSCIKGTCPQRIVVMVVGGRFGKIEQFIEGEPVPETGDLLGITVAPGTSLEMPNPARARVYRLSVASDFTAFTRGLEAAGLKAALPLPGSAAPSR